MALSLRAADPADDADRLSPYEQGMEAHDPADQLLVT
jgi:hypothetical protein